MLSKTRESEEKVTIISTVCPNPGGEMTLIFTLTNTQVLRRCWRKGETQLSWKAEKRRDILFQDKDKDKGCYKPLIIRQKIQWKKIFFFSFTRCTVSTLTAALLSLLHHTYRHTFHTCALWDSGVETREEKNLCLMNAYQWLASDRWGPALHLIGIIPSHQCLKVPK